MKTFKEAYDVLSRHAQTLREQSEPNIDDLLSIVNESVEAYKVCQARIAAVDEALQAALRNTGQAASETGDMPSGPARAAAGGPSAARISPNPADPEDDIPF